MLINEKMTWGEANENCRKLDAQLASLTNEPEFDLANQLMPNITAIWIGGWNTAEEGEENHVNQWKWLTGQQLANQNGRWGYGRYDDMTGEFDMEVFMPPFEYNGDKFLAYQKGLSPFSNWRKDRKYLSLCEKFD